MKLGGHCYILREDEASSVSWFRLPFGKLINFTVEIYLFIKTAWFLKLSGQASNPVRLSTQRSLTVLSSREKMNFAFPSSWKRVLIYKSTQGKNLSETIMSSGLRYYRPMEGELCKPEDQNKALKQNISVLSLVSVRFCGACLTMFPPNNLA